MTSEELPVDTERIMNKNQTYMRKMGVSTEKLDEIVKTLQQQPGILGAKISGSGLGDCVLGLGESDLEQIPVEMSVEGLIVE